LIEHNENMEKAIAVAWGKKGGDRALALEYLDELEFLAETAGAEVVEKIYQELEHPNKAYMIGKGKMYEVKEIIDAQEIKLVLFDNDLSPVQLRNLELKLEVKVVDRSGLILDIFAKHAQTQEAKTQVELAQAQYLLPRLTRMWTHLSKQYGGVGTKGPGETQIETDRRLLRTRIQRLKAKLDNLDTQKEQQRKGRDEYPTYALVGYTNAGKSTLMNNLTNADVYVQNQLFATLDTTVRSFNFENGQKALISDTVGFIRKLPTHLVASFRSTLTEARNADVLMHVVDVSHKLFREQIQVVNDTLRFLKINDKPQILVFNKMDMVEDRYELLAIEEEFPNSILVSAQESTNIDKLLDLMQRKYDEQSKVIDILLPYSEMQLVQKIYTFADIVSREDTDDGVAFSLRISSGKEEYFNNYFSQYAV
jgi:GTP-binding protein HflX